MKLALAHPHAAPLAAIAAQVCRGDGHELAWSSRDGREVARLCVSTPVDLLLLDIGFTGPSSVEIARSVLAAHACAVLLLADRPHAHVSAIYEAMGLGAFDVVRIPAPLEPDDGDAIAALRAKLDTASKLLGRGRRRPSAPPAGAALDRAQPRLVALGASTGGPQALFGILGELPRDLDAALVIAQHVDGEFTQGLADWLQQGTQLRVRLATEGCRPQAGTALLAGSNDHLALLSGGCFGYTREPRHLPYRPSIDVLFRSLAEHWRTPGVAVLLTGMGRDGAQGLKQLKSAGWHTVAQDETSSVVYGMPKAAIGLGAAEHVLPLQAIGAQVTRLCRAPARRPGRPRAQLKG